MFSICQHLFTLGVEMDFTRNGDFILTCSFGHLEICTCVLLSIVSISFSKVRHILHMLHLLPYHICYINKLPGRQHELYNEKQTKVHLNS